MKVLIIEDENHSAERLQRYIRTLHPDYEISGITKSIVQSIDFLQREQPDLIFSDIRLQDGLSFDIFRQIKDELEAAIQKATERISRSSPVTTAPKLEQLLEYLGGAVPTPHYRERFLVSRKDEYITIEVQNVCFIHSQQNITRLYLTDGTSATIPYTLDQLEKEMNPASFFRANRQHMIQVRHIKKVSNWFNYKLKVEMNGYPQEEILISREKAATFKKWLDK